MRADSAGVAGAATSVQTEHNKPKVYHVRQPVGPRPVRPPLSHYWEYADLYGRYHVRKIKSEFPIPGTAVTREKKRQKNIKDYTDGLSKWIDSTKKGLDTEVKTRTLAAIDFLACSENGRSSQRIINALEPALIKRRRAFNRVNTYKNHCLTELEDEFTDFDYRKVLPHRDYRNGVMPPLRLRQLQLTEKKKAEFHDETCIFVPNHKLMQNAGIAPPDFVPQPTMAQRLVSRYSARTPLKRFRTRTRNKRTISAAKDTNPNPDSATKDTTGISTAKNKT